MGRPACSLDCARPVALVHRPGAGRLGQDRAADPALSGVAGARRAARGDRRDHLHPQGRGRDAKARAGGARIGPQRRAPARAAARAYLEARPRGARARRGAWLAAGGKRRPPSHPDHRLAVRVADAPDAGAFRLRRAARQRRGRECPLPGGRAGDARAAGGEGRGRGPGGEAARPPGQQRHGRRGPARRHARAARPLAAKPARRAQSRSARGGAGVGSLRSRGKGAGVFRRDDGGFAPGGRRYRRLAGIRRNGADQSRRMAPPAARPR